jgi:hypothetical protein
VRFRTQPGVRPSAPGSAVRETTSQIATLLRLHGTIGNQAVAALLQRDSKKKARRDPPPIADLYAGDTLDQAGWKAVHDNAEKARATGAMPEAQRLYAKLLADAATVAGLGAVPGFDSQQVHLEIGLHKDAHKNAKPGLNLSMEDGDEPGHTAWIDAAGKFSQLDLRRGATKQQIAMVVNYSALKVDKALSMRVIRHEMVHVIHHQLILEAIRSWETKGRKGDLGQWLDRNAGNLGLSGVHLPLIKEGVAGGKANTEVLASVEGFMTEFHHTKPTPDGASAAFFELLGAVEISSMNTWVQADRAVQREATARLRAYHATLDKAHKDAWKDWVNRQLAATGNQPGRKDFLAKLAQFMQDH